MKRFLLCLTAASLCAGAWATPLSPEEALRSALGYGRRAAIPAIRAEKSYSLVWSGTDAGTYVFNSSRGGYLIASGNSDFDALIGYSDSGSFDPADIPDGPAAVPRALDSPNSAGLRKSPPAWGLCSAPSTRRSAPDCVLPPPPAPRAKRSPRWSEQNGIRTRPIIC